MDLSTIDWVIIITYILFSLGVGIYFARRAGKNTEEYFLAGRTLPWWVVGTSMVATTFAADTPLAITEFVRGPGIWQNWFWWNQLLAGLLGVLLFSRLWRRAKVLTDNELLEIRYSGKPAAILRGFKAAYFGILYNFIVMGWVINAMASVVAVMLNIDRWTAVWILVAVALIYALLSGFWGVVITDLVQFAIAMFGSIALAVIAVQAFGGMEVIISKINALQISGDGIGSTNTLKFIPPVPDAGFFTLAFWESPFSRFLIFLTVMWWSTHSTDGGGYIIQRMSSAKNEKHALMATLWFNLAHYALRVWPWIIVAMVSIVAFPIIPEQYAALGEKAGYPLVMKMLLGPGMKGLLVVSFLAAFMSTIDTHLNWGTSYLINDIYKRFFKPVSHFSSEKDAQKHYIIVSRFITVVMMVCAAFFAIKMQSVSKAWEFIFAMGAGIGLVLILRWFWWRINAWSEITALLTSMVITIGLEIVAAIQTSQSGESYTLFGNAPILFGLELQVHHKLLIIVPISVIAWVSATFLTKPESEKTLKTFYKRVQPGGWWGPIAHQLETTMQPVTKGFFLNWISGLALVWGATFSIGNFIFGNWKTGLGLSILALAGFGWIWFKNIALIDEAGTE
jgi:Na+/proline symporter